MRRSRILAIGTAAVVAAALSLFGMAGGASAGGPKHAPAPASRVVIVLFDQMLPQYADQFGCPTSASCVTPAHYNKAYLGYMASETVIAHNVIPSGLLPRNMGYTDEAYRDIDNIFGKRHRTRCTSPATSASRTSPPSRRTTDSPTRSSRTTCTPLVRHEVHHRR